MALAHLRKIHFTIALATGFTIGPAITTLGAPSCIDTAGREQAERYAHQCQIVEESLHWPCNAKNRCSDIIASIQRGCTDVHYARLHYSNLQARFKEPSFCKEYINRDGLNLR